MLELLEPAGAASSVLSFLLLDFSAVGSHVTTPTNCLTMVRVGDMLKKKRALLSIDDDLAARNLFKKFASAAPFGQGKDLLMRLSNSEHFEVRLFEVYSLPLSLGLVLLCA
jgi:hypothetical protein